MTREEVKQESGRYSEERHPERCNHGKNCTNSVTLTVQGHVMPSYCADCGKLTNAKQGRVMDMHEETGKPLTASYTCRSFVLTMEEGGNGLVS